MILLLFIYTLIGSCFAYVCVQDGKLKGPWPFILLMSLWPLCIAMMFLFGFFRLLFGMEAKRKQVDYKLLLEKYMRLVAHVEGVTFVDECSTLPESSILFTPTELEALEELQSRL